MQDVIAQLARIPLSGRIHASVDEGVSILECAAYLAGEKHSSHPKCACSIVQVVSDYINRYYDGRYNTALAQRALQIAGSRGDDLVSYHRSLHLVNFVFRDFAPRLLRSPLFADNSPDYAALATKLEGVPKITAHYEFDMVQRILQHHRQVPRAKSVQERHVNQLLHIIDHMRFLMFSDVVEGTIGLFYYHRYIAAKAIPRPLGADPAEEKGTPFDALVLLDDLLAIDAGKTPPLAVTPDVAARIAYLTNYRTGALQ